MTDDPHVVAMCGSLRAESATRTVLETSLAAAAEAGATTTLVDLREFDLPPLNADDPDAGDAAALRAAVDAADAVALGTPNYHGSYSGPLKNALDYCGRDEFAGTTVGLVEVAAGSFPRPALLHLRAVARTLDAWCLPHEVAVPNSHTTVQGGEITDARLRERVRELGEHLVDYAGVERYPELEPSVPNATGRSDA